MKAFGPQRAAAARDAARSAGERPGALFLAGGTTLVDLMKVEVLTPDTVIDVRPLGMSSIDVSDDHSAIATTVTNNQLVWHPTVVPSNRHPLRGDASSLPTRVGELAITGMAAAIANAVYQATGTRVRSLPISVETLRRHSSFA